MIPIPPSSPLRIAPLRASLLLIATAIGAIVLSGIAVLTLVPLTIIVGGMAVALVSTLLLGWAGIEALAAVERWMDQDPRFQR
ncbi:MAG: glypican [Cyanobium sp.]